MQVSPQARQQRHIITGSGDWDSKYQMHLHEGAEWRQAGAGPNHDDGRGGILRQPKVRVPADVHRQLVAHLQQVTC